MQQIDLDRALRSAMTTVTGPRAMPVNMIRRNLLHANVSMGTSVLVEWLEQLVLAAKVRKGSNQGVDTYELIRQVPAAERIRQLLKNENGTLNIRDIRRRCGLGLLETKRALDLLIRLEEVRRLDGTWNFERPPLTPQLASVPATGNIFDDFFGDGRMFSVNDLAVAAQLPASSAQKGLRSALRSGYIQSVPGVSGRYRVTRRTMQPGAVKSLVEARRKYYGADEADPASSIEKALLAVQADLEFALLVARGVEGEEARMRLIALAQTVERSAEQVLIELASEEVPAAA
jgi:hypothetical protein